MVLESGVLPPPLQLYAAAAAHLAPRPPWAPLLQFPGAAASLLGMPGAFGPLARPRYPGGGGGVGGMGPVMRASAGPPSEDSGSETHHGKGKPLYYVDFKSRCRRKQKTENPKHLL